MRLAAALLLLALAGAAPASAATVRVSSYDFEDIREDVHTTTMRFVAKAGERNRLTVRSAGQAVVFVDRGARLRAGRRCRSITRHKARCRFDGGYRDQYFRVTLGDRADAYRARSFTGVTPDVRGGDGPDRLRGGPGSDELRGGRGDDTLGGGGGPDVLRDGPGADAVDGGAGRDDLHTDPGDDRLDGGAGRDTVSYEDRSAPVTATLGATSGQPGERDRLVAVEALVGGEGDDVLRGTEGADVLDGGRGGADRLYGRGGDDELDGSSGAGDRFYAGPGADRIQTYAASRVSCGPGRDVALAFEDDLPLLRPDCERFGSGAKRLWPAQPLRTTRRTVVMRLPCATRDRLRLRRVQLLAGGAVIAQGRRRAGKGTCRVRLRARAPLHRTIARVHYVGGGPDWRIVLRP